MGIYFADQYSLLHFATGVIAYFFAIKLRHWFIIHLSFEMLENTEFGMELINKYFSNIWPGKKNYADSLTNSILGDNMFAILGWIVAYLLDNYGAKYQWFGKHLDSYIVI